VRCGLGAVCSKRTRNSNGPARTTAARARGGSTGGSYGEASGEDLLGEFVESDGVGDISSLVGCRPIPGRYLKPRSWDVSGMACQQLIADPQELLIDRNCAGSGGSARSQRNQIVVGRTIPKGLRGVGRLGTIRRSEQSLGPALALRRHAC